MISLTAYRLIHLISIFALFIAFGAAMTPLAEKKRWPVVLHGIALLFILLAGFGMLARLGISWPLPGWVWGKLGIWLLLGGSIALVKRKLLPASALIVGLLILGGLAGYFALWRPF
jgi:hypothetical protein